MKHEYLSAIAEVDFASNSFLFKDVDGITNHKTVEFTSLEASDKNKGHGTTLLKNLVSEYDDYLIVIKAEPMFKTEKEYSECDDYDIRLQRLVRFYEARGFVNINKYTGYESAVAMCYNNDAYIDLRRSLLTKFNVSI